MLAKDYGDGSIAAIDWHLPYNYGFARHFAALAAGGALLLSVKWVLEAGIITAVVGWLLGPSF